MSKLDSKCRMQSPMQWAVEQQREYENSLSFINLAFCHFYHSRIFTCSLELVTLMLHMHIILVYSVTHFFLFLPWFYIMNFEQNFNYFSSVTHFSFVFAMILYHEFDKKIKYFSSAHLRCTWHRFIWVDVHVHIIQGENIRKTIDIP